TAVGVNSGSGLITGTGGLTITGAANINAAGTAITNIGNSTGILTLASGGVSSWTNTANNLTIQTATSGILALTSAGALNLTGAVASAWSIGTGNALTLTSQNFRVDSAGNITVVAGQGLDAIAAGILNFGNTTATTVNVGNTAAVTLAIGAGGALTRTINIGTGTGADTISIGTGGGSDIIAIGGGAGTLAVNTGDWDISTTGVMTGISGITTNGGYTQSGTDANAFTGTSTFSNATYSALFTSGNVGIGTVSPSSKLHIAQSGSSIEILRPNAVGDEENIAVGTGGTGLHWSAVDEETPDNLVTNVSNNNDAVNYQRDLYNIPNHSAGSGAINFIKVYTHVFSYPGGNSVKIAIKSGIGTGAPTTASESAEISPTPNTWETHSNQWDTNPATGQAFTWAEIDNLQIGVSLKKVGGYTTYSTQVYIEVDYTSPTMIVTGGLVGIGTTAPGKTLEINAATGGSLRLTYNDSDGSAANYNDFLVGSSGDLTIIASGGDISLDNENLATTGTITSGLINSQTISSAANFTGTGAFASTLTASNGLTLTTGALNLTATSGVLALSGLSTSSISTGANGLTFVSGGTSSWANTSGNLTISTVTSGTLALTSAGALNLSAAAASTWTLPAVANALNFDSNTLSIDASGNMVGIGTAAPSAKLTVRSDSTGAVVSLLRMENLDTAAIGTGGSVDFYAMRTTSGTTQFTSLESVVTSADATYWSGKLNMKVASNGELVTMMEIGNPNIVLNRPLEVNVAGDTGISYDLAFLSTGNSNITSYGPLTIAAGDPNHAKNLTLTTQSNQATGDSGVATGATATTLTDSTKSALWVADAWIGGSISIISGTGSGQTQTITTNTTTAITVADWDTALGDPAVNSVYQLSYAKGGDVLVAIQNSDLLYGGFKVSGGDNGGYVFRVSASGNVEIGGNGAGPGNLVVKQNLSLTGGNITVNKLSTPTNGVAACTTVTAGGLVDGTYYYRVSAINNNGETLAMAEFNSPACAATGVLNSVTVTWDAVAGATAYKVYGRTTGTELYMKTVSAPNLIFVDNDSTLTPLGALPASNTTG
ncbi:MAG: hypothetical protein KJ689_13560, partial [Bacteroidetes bacterium]|nr:hypothetical protein [Bacteroidota bacterium]